MRKLTAIVSLVAVVSLLVGLRAAPADAHYLAAGVTTPDALGDCHVNSRYFTFGNAVADITFTSMGCDGFYTQVGVQTAYNGQAWTAWCSAGQATFTPTQWCFWADNDPIVLRAVAPGTAFGMAVYLVSGGSSWTFTHGAFG